MTTTDPTINPVSAERKPRKPHPRKIIPLPNGDTLVPRSEFADDIGVTERTLQKWDLPTRYVGGAAYIQRNASLEIIAAGVKRRNQPPTKRRHSRGRS